MRRKLCTREKLYDEIYDVSHFSKFYICDDIYKYLIIQRIISISSKVIIQRSSLRGRNYGITFSVQISKLSLLHTNNNFHNLRQKSRWQVSMSLEKARGYRFGPSFLRPVCLNTSKYRITARPRGIESDVAQIVQSIFTIDASVFYCKTYFYTYVYVLLL